MTYADNFWLCMDDPANLMVITAFMEFEELVDFKRLKSTVEQRLTSFPRFRKKVVKSPYGVGAPTWEFDGHFDIRSHIHRIALPGAGDKEELQNMVGDFMTTPLDYKKPLWQVHLIENYGEGCVILFRIHHCIADGIALIHTLLSTADTDPDAPWPEKMPPVKRKHTTSLFPWRLGSVVKSLKRARGATLRAGEKLLSECREVASNPDQLVELAKTGSELTTDVAAILTRLTVMPSDPDTAFKGRLGVKKTAVWTEPMSLDKIKIVGKAISTATLNDVLIATVTGAMRRYLKTRNHRVNELDLRVLVPVNIRKPGTENELGNKFSLVFLPLPVYIEDPVLRLKEVRRRTDHLKKSADAMVNFGLMSAVGVLPDSFARQFANFFSNKASAVLTNVPGPKEPLYFAGKKINNMMFWVPRSGMVGLGISILSYDGKVTVGIASDEGLMPDPEVLLEGFEDEFNHLLDLVMSGKIYDEPLVLHDRYKESRCKAVNEDDEPCKRAAFPGFDYCEIHHPDSVADGGELARDDDAARMTGFREEERGRCQALTKKGTQCRNRANPGVDYCTLHQAAAAEADARELGKIIKELSER